MPPRSDADREVEARHYKELVDKLSWAIGSTYKERYGKRTKIYTWACRTASLIVDARREGELSP